MRRSFSIQMVLLLTLTVPAVAFADMRTNGTYAYSGDFKMTSQEGQGCGEFFVPSHQIARLGFIGVSNRNIVINMSADNGQQGPLIGLNLVGLYGNGDFRVERSGMDVGRKLLIVMEGYVSSNFMASELTVQRYDVQGNMICSAKGDFYGSPSL